MPRRQRSPFVEALASLKEALADLGVSWYLFGAQAALIYGSTRATADLDATVRLGSVTTKNLVARLRLAGFRPRFSGAKFIEQTRVLPVVHRETGVAADLVLSGPGLEELFLKRSVQKKLGDVMLPVASLEDIVAMKILAARNKDHEDVLDVLRANLKTANLGLIRETLSLIEAALDQSDLVPTLERLLARARNNAKGAKPKPHMRAKELNSKGGGDPKGRAKSAKTVLRK